MGVTRTARENLKRDRRVLGEPWRETYQGFFVNPRYIDDFITAVWNYLPRKKELKILYAASASGLLGEALVARLRKHDIKAKLTLVDLSKEHLDENKNPETTKICADLLNVDLRDTFDVVLMRSSLDYFPDDEMQVQLLRRIRHWLGPGGVFLNQLAALVSKEDRDTVDEVYRSNRKFGKRHFQCEEDIYSVYEKAGLNVKKIADANCPELLLTEWEHKERYGIDEEDVKQVQRILETHQNGGLRVTKTGYRMHFIFPIFVATV